MKILITGGAGYLGSVITKRMLDEGHEVIVLDKLIFNQTSLLGYTYTSKFRFVYGDVRNEKLLEKLCNEVDVIIPLAAIVGAPACDRDPVLATSINKDSVNLLLKNISSSQQIIMPTTNSAYGSGGNDNYCDENSPLNPLSLYARDKVEVEKSLMNHSKATSFRLATVFGVSPRMRLDLLVNNFCYRAITDRFVIVFEGHFKRNYIHLLDVCQAFELALSKPEQFQGEIFNVGLSTANVSKLELCAVIKQRNPEFTYLEAPLGKDPDQRNYLVSNAKIESKGFNPKVNLESGIDELSKFLKMFDQRSHSNI